MKVIIMLIQFQNIFDGLKIIANIFIKIFFMIKPNILRT